MNEIKNIENEDKLSFESVIIDDTNVSVDENKESNIKEEKEIKLYKQQLLARDKKNESCCCCIGYKSRTNDNSNNFCDNIFWYWSSYLFFSNNNLNVNANENTNANSDSMLVNCCDCNGTADNFDYCCSSCCDYFGNTICICDCEDV